MSTDSMRNNAQIVFYEPPERTDRVLRLGDVVKGYVLPSTKIKEPFLSFENRVYHNYEINVEVPSFSVVLTPCCSIGDQMVCLTPLIHLRKDFPKNPYFAEDFSRINRMMDPEKTLSPTDWEQLGDEEKQRISAKVKPYTLLDFFVYAPSDIFMPYDLRGQPTKFYMIDFRNIHTLKCELIKNRDKIEQEEESVLESKCLQLSETTREELRHKLSFYYGRPSEAE